MSSSSNNGSVTETLKDSVKGFVDQGQHKVEELKDRVGEAKDRVVDRGMVLFDRVAKYIQTNPLKSIAMAFGAGYLGMRMFRR